MFMEYLSTEQENFFRQLSLEMVSITKKDELKERNLFPLVQTNNSIKTTIHCYEKRPEKVFNSRRVRFIVLFELYLTVLNKGRIFFEEESYLIWLGRRFGFSEKEILDVFDLANEACSLFFTAKTFITQSNLLTSI